MIKVDRHHGPSRSLLDNRHGGMPKDSIFSDQSNTQFIMESSSDSDFSIESATSRSLSNISKKKKMFNFPESREQALSNQKKVSRDDNRTNTVPSQSKLMSKQNESEKTGYSNTFPKSVSDREFTKTKELLYNLSNDAMVEKSPFYLKLEAIRNSLNNYAQQNNIYVGSYDFVSLLATILLLCGKALHCVLHINIALLPLYEILIHVVRFVLEQIVVIEETRSGQEKLKASIKFVLQTAALLLMTIFIYSSVLFPILIIGMSIFWKIGYFLLL